MNNRHPSLFPARRTKLKQRFTDPVPNPAGTKNPQYTSPFFAKIINHTDVEGCFQAFMLACHVDGLAPDTIRSYQTLVGNFISFTTNTGILDPALITPNHIRQYIITKQKTCKPSSLHSYYRHVKRFFSWLVDEAILQVSPMANIKAPRVPRVLIHSLVEEEIRRLLSVCDENQFLGMRNKAIILIFVDTAIRLSEMARIKLEDIDFARRIIKILGKGAKERVVHLDRLTIKALLKYLMQRNDSHPCLWVTEEREPLTKQGLAQMIRILRQRAGVKCSAHKFRHTAATMALQNGASEFEVQAMLGHSTLEMTKRYAADINSYKAAESHKRFSPVKNLNLR